MGNNFKLTAGAAVKIRRNVSHPPKGLSDPRKPENRNQKDLNFNVCVQNVYVFLSPAQPASCRRRGQEEKAAAPQPLPQVSERAHFGAESSLRKATSDPIGQPRRGRVPDTQVL